MSETINQNEEDRNADMPGNHAPTTAGHNGGVEMRNELYLSRDGQILAILTGGTDEERRRIATTYYQSVDVSDTCEGLVYPVSPLLFDLVSVENTYREVYIGVNDQIISPAEYYTLGFQSWPTDDYGRGFQCLRCGRVFGINEPRPAYHMPECPLYYVIDGYGREDKSTP